MQPERRDDEIEENSRLQLAILHVPVQRTIRHNRSLAPTTGNPLVLPTRRSHALSIPLVDVEEALPSKPDQRQTMGWALAKYCDEDEEIESNGIQVPCYNPSDLKDRMIMKRTPAVIMSPPIQRFKPTLTCPKLVRSLNPLDVKFGLK